MARTMEESEKLYHEAKKFFSGFIGHRVLIEISDCPMDEWRVLKKYSDEEMDKERQRVNKHNLPFVAFGVMDNEFYYQYSDNNILKREEPMSGRVACFYDIRKNELELALVRKELGELIKILNQKNSSF